MKEIEEIRKKLKKELDAYRYQHTLGVMYTAASLAMKYCEDLNDTMMAGILHDCAKCISDDEKMKLCLEYHIPLTETEIQNPGLIHSK